MKTLLHRFFTLMTVILICACGGGGSSSSGESITTTTSTAPTPATATLSALTLSPANPTIAVGTTLQLVASGTYTDGSVKVVTTGLTWASSVAHSQIFTNGLVKGLSMGNDTLLVTLGAISGSTTLTVKGPYAEVSAGGGHTMAALANSTLIGWGLNRSGQLGDGTALDRLTPTATSGSTSTWLHVSAGEFHTLATRTDNSLWCWGLNQNGQLGDKTVVDRLSPVQVGTDKKWLMVSAGRAHSVGVKDDGTLWAWGRNFDGQLGDITGVDKFAPVQVLMSPPAAGSTTATTAVAADKIWAWAGAGTNFTVGRKTDSTVYTWGGNERGQLGNNKTIATPIATNVPTVVSGLRAIAVATGYAHVLAIRSDGALFAWGANDVGQLGVAAVTDIPSPTQIGTDTDWKAISAGGAHSLALRIDGSLWAWGANADGQLGLGTTTPARTPVKVGASRDWVAISAGKSHSLALKSDGTLWIWGRNVEGQQGNGALSTAQVLVPTQLQ